MVHLHTPVLQTVAIIGVGRFGISGGGGGGGQGSEYCGGGGKMGQIPSRHMTSY